METNVIDRKHEEITSNEEESPKLKNWFYHGDKSFPYNIEGNILSGNVYDHPKFDNGAYIYTSKVIFINRLVGIGQTMNTTYILIGPEASRQFNKK